MVLNPIQFNKRRLIVSISICLIIGVSILFLILPLMGYAEDPEPTIGQKIDAISDMNIENAKIMLGVQSGFMKSALSFADNVSQYVSGIAAIYVIGLMIFAVFREVVQGRTQLDMVMQVVVKVIIGVAIIAWTPTLLSLIDTIGSGILDGFADNAKTSIQVISNDTETTSGIFSSIGVSVLSIMGYILKAYIKIISYALFIEMGLRRLFAPLAVASIVLDGTRSPGMRYLKKYLAVYIKLVIVVGCVALAGALVQQSILNSLNATSFDAASTANPEAVSAAPADGSFKKTVYKISLGFENIIECFAIMFGCTGFIGKSSNLADEIVGVR